MKTIFQNSLVYKNPFSRQNDFDIICFVIYWHSTFSQDHVFKVFYKEHFEKFERENKQFYKRSLLIKNPVQDKITIVSNRKNLNLGQYPT